MKYRYATGKPKDNYIIHRDVLNNLDYLRYSKELVGRNELRLPDFTSLDLRVNYNFKFRTANLTIFIDIVNVFNKQIANSESFNSITGQNYYDGLAIFPTGGLKFEL
jgi:outer membrane receptor protein involved in Fe transport